jgi:heavy metal translocating P-type ATPase
MAEGGSAAASKALDRAPVDGATLDGATRGGASRDGTSNDGASRAGGSPIGVSRDGVSRDSWIAAIVLALIAIHLGGRFLLGWRGWHSDWPLWMAVAAGAPLLWELGRKLTRLEFGADLIAGVSIVSAAFMREYLVAAIVVLMLSGGQALESYATQRASSVLQALARRLPSQAHVAEGGGFTDRPLVEIRAGDRVLVLPHEICPVDGDVIEGHGRMNEAFLTGEPFEIAKAPGAQALTGAVNGDTALTVRVSRPAEDSRYARILSVLRETELHQPRMRRVADRLGAWYTPLALAIAGAAWMAGGSAERFLAVTVIATPCPLLLAIPVAIIGGISLAAREGIVIRNPAVLEQISACRVFIFDKTGTLTYGRPRLKRVRCAQPWHEEELLSLAASLENYSRHPLARGVLEAARRRGVTAAPAANVSERPGEGMRGAVSGHAIHITGRQAATALYGSVALLRMTAGDAGGEAADGPGGNGAAAAAAQREASRAGAATGPEFVMIVDGAIAGVFEFEDEPRADSLPFIGHLRPRHAAERLVLLSGDKEPAVRRLGELVGIEEIHAAQSPEEKLAYVREQSKRAKTLFAGDGINDAPAMLAATVGVALGGTSEAISQAAGAVVMDSSLRSFDKLIHIGARMRRIGLQSAVGGMSLSGIGMIAAAFGLLPPVAGAVGQEAIDLLVVLNALRVALGRWDEDLTDF